MGYDNSFKIRGRGVPGMGMMNDGVMIKIWKKQILFCFV
jgi:hypothetical protein